MAEFQIIRLKDLSPLHIGTGTENYYSSSGVLQSDTVSSALVAVGIQTGVLKESEITYFLNSFKISSAFPYCENEYYLPVSGGKIVLDDPKYEKKYRKELKDMKFLEAEENFPVWASGKKLKTKLVKDNNAQSGNKKHVAERVTIAENLSTPFFFEWSFYEKNCGLYFILDCDKDAFEKVFKLFNILGEFGIGTDKNIGGGNFEVEKGQIELPDVNNPDATMILSSYIPEEKEFGCLNLQSSNYQLIKRGGYIAGSDNETFRHLRKKPVYLFASGSVFNTTQTLEGKIVDLAPKYENMHPIYRSGRPLTLKIKLQQQ